jgi:lipopolysaccharide transport system permease protein
MVDLAIASVILFVLLAVYGIPLTAAALWALPTLLVLATLAFSASLVLAAVNVRYRDVTMAMPLLLQAWLFVSPVIYPISAVPERWRGLYLLNPMAGVVDSFRRAVVEGRPPDPVALGWAAVAAAAALPVAYLWFKHADATLADRI